MKPRAAQVSVDPSGLVVVTTSNVQAALAELDAALASAGGYTDEQVRDVIGAALVAGSNITITPDDAGNTITIAATGGGAGGASPGTYDVYAVTVSQAYNYASTSVRITTSGAGSTEVIATGMDVTQAPGTAVEVQIDVDVWTSMNRPGVVKAGTLRLRRGGLTGAILASFSLTDTGDSTAGHMQRWQTTVTDTAPTTGEYVVTVQSNDAACEVWSDERHLTVSARALKVDIA